MTAHTTVKLYGDLAYEFGGQHQLFLRRPIDMRSAFRANFAKFDIAFLRNPEYAILCDGESLDITELFYPRDIKLLEVVPVYAGSGKGLRAAVKIVAAVAILYFTGGTRADAAISLLSDVGVEIARGVAVALLTSGVSSALTPSPNDRPDGDNDINNYFFGSGGNTFISGYPVPVCYGEVLTGAHTVSGFLVNSDEVKYDVVTGAQSTSPGATPPPPPIPPIIPPITPPNNDGGGGGNGGGPGGGGNGGGPGGGGNGGGPGGGGGGGPGGGGGGGGTCFAENTLVLMQDGAHKRIGDIRINDTIAGGGRVFAVQRGVCVNDDWYRLNGVRVTGSHTVFDRGEWKLVQNAKGAEFIRSAKGEEYVTLRTMNYILITAGGTVFSDMRGLPDNLLFSSDMIANMNSYRPEKAATPQP